MAEMLGMLDLTLDRVFNPQPRAYLVPMYALSLTVT